MSGTKLFGHSKLIVEIGEGAVGIKRAGIKDCLSGLLDLCPLFGGRGAPQEVVVDGGRITVITFKPSANNFHPHLMWTLDVRTPDINSEQGDIN